MALPSIACASVPGGRHLHNGTPCQDASSCLRLDSGWVIAAVSDGMGSARLADLGSRFIVDNVLHVLEEKLYAQIWFTSNALPTPDQWESIAHATLLQCREGLISYAGEMKSRLEEFDATVILVLCRPEGACIAHIGDGRAAIRKTGLGTWSAIMVPHRGQYSNQTYSLTMEDWLEDRTRIGAAVVVVGIEAVVLLTDGCENAAFFIHRIDPGTGLLVDPNEPNPKFFDPLYFQLRKIGLSHGAELWPSDAWEKFLHEGTPKLMSEQDDKTLVMICLQ